MNEPSVGPMDRVHLINYITRIQFGFGAVQLLEAELHRLAVDRPLLITDAGVVKNGLDRRVVGVNVAATFSDTPSNPTEAAAKAAMSIYRGAKCNGIVALGGGSPMDLAKAVALHIHHDGPLSSYALVNGGLERITANVPPVIAIPTTAGTGSEAARAAVLIMDDGAKRVLASPHLIPRVAICDPELTLDLPAYLTAATGFDAIAHCIETFCSPSLNPPADAIALDGLRRSLASIEVATFDGANREARWQMLMASLEGGMTFQKGLGAVHALSHPLGELRLHHGTLNAVLLPHVLDHNLPHVRDKLRIVEQAVGLPGSRALSQHLARLLRRLGLPERLSTLGVSAADVPAIARKAVLDSCNATNPVMLAAADYERILYSAL